MYSSLELIGITAAVAIIYTIKGWVIADKESIEIAIFVWVISASLSLLSGNQKNEAGIILVMLIGTVIYRLLSHRIT